MAAALVTKAVIGIFVEPEDGYAARMRISQLLPRTPAATHAAPPKPTSAVPCRFDDFWTEIVFEILKANGDEPVRITTVANESLKWGKFTNRGERVGHKKMMFRVVGRLIRCCRLDRLHRKFVTIPSSDTRRQAFLAEAAKPLNLPPPSI
ncbi:MAG: hypothetical protein ABSH48_26065 [Verrucomicrobiota bacterium]